MKHFAFLKKVCYQYYNFVLWVTYCFLTSCWLAHNQLSWSVLLLPCNLIGQLCLRCPGYTAFQFILSCRPSEGSPRPHANFFHHILLNTYAICWARKPSLPGHWPETHFSSRTLVTVVARLQNSPYFCVPGIQVRGSSQTKGLERGWKQRARLGRDVMLYRFLYSFWGKNWLFCTLSSHPLP